MHRVLSRTHRGKTKTNPGENISNKFKPMRSFETTQPALLYLWVRLPTTKLDDERVKALPKMRLEINNCQNGTAAAYCGVRARAGVLGWRTRD